MQLDAILCNHAEAVNNLLYIAAGGIDTVYVPAGINPPYPVTLGIAVMITVPWSQASEQHKVDIELVSEDGEPVQVPVTPELMQPLRSTLTFNVDRSAGTEIGDDQHVCLAANLPGFPLSAFGKYEFIVRLDGQNERRLPCRLRPVVDTEMTTGPGPMAPEPGQWPS